MTYQDELLNNLIDALEKALWCNLKNASITNAQKVSGAKHEQMRFIKSAKYIHSLV